MKPSPVAQNDMPKAKLSQGKAPEMDNEAKMSGYERSAVTSNRKASARAKSPTRSPSQGYRR